MLPLNLDRPTLNFFNSFSDEVRVKAEEIQKNKQVLQIFGRPLFIQSKVVVDDVSYKTVLRLQSNRWFGSCKTDNKFLEEVCQYATMLEKLEHGDDLPSFPQEFEDTPLLQIIEDKLQRDLDDREADYVSKIEKRYRRYIIEGEIHDYDLVRLNPKWEIGNQDVLDLWLVAPADIIEFWNYIAYAFFKKDLIYPDFLSAITDLDEVANRIKEWEKEKEIAAWYDRINIINKIDTNEESQVFICRLSCTINEVKLQYKIADEEWAIVKDKGELEKLDGLYQKGLLEADTNCQIIWNYFYNHYKETEEFYFNLEEKNCCYLMNKVFSKPYLLDNVVNLDGENYRFSDRRLSWLCEYDERQPNSYFLSLITSENVKISHSVRFLDGFLPLYQSDQTVFQGPINWHDETEIMPTYEIPSSVIESLEGVEFLRKIAAKLPNSLEEKIIDFELYPKLKMQIVKGLSSPEVEHLLVDVYTEDKEQSRKEKLTRLGWEQVKQKNIEDKLSRFSREHLKNIPKLLDKMGLNYDRKLEKFKVRVTKQFPEKFAEWIREFADEADLKLDGKLSTLLADPVAASIQFEVVNQEIDWFDLKIVINVDGVTLTKAQIKQLIGARGGYVRMEDGGWMRLEIKLDQDQKEAVTRLGLDPFDLSGETHRMHALQLSDPKSFEVFDPETWQKIQACQEKIQLDSQAEVPALLQADLRPYQKEGFKFLSYLAINNFGGVLADDMGLGKTIQTITYILWLKEHNERKTGQKMPCLVVCPKSVLDVWVTESKKFAPSLNTKLLQKKTDFNAQEVEQEIDVLITNYGQLRVCAEELNTVKWLLIVLDEGQQIKNPDSKVSVSARELSANNRLVLTGTPIENRLMDMWSIMSFCMPGVLGSRNYFKKTFDKKKDPVAESRLVSRLKPFLLRRTKRNVAKDLPERTEKELFADMEGIQQELYKAELLKIQKAITGIDTEEQVSKNSFTILQSLMRLRQICSHPGLINPKYIKEESAKMNALFYLLNELREQGHKVLVFSQFVSMLDIIKSQLIAQNYPYHYLTGQTKDRKSEIDKFQTSKDPSVFLLSLKAGGAGLNLTSASYVILYDPWWNPAVENQAIDRTHRIGQKNKVIAYRLLTKNSVEEKIRILQHQKTAMVNSILGDETLTESLNLKDLQFIFSHQET